MKPLALILFCSLISILLPTLLHAEERPKLVVVISLDQFRYDYLERFGDHFGEGGFNLFLQRGASFTQTFYEHSQTKTGPGHAVILSGSHGAQNGIIANHWLSRQSYKTVYCVDDPSVRPVGTSDDNARRSPKNFIGSTVGDELKLAYANQPKVISISNKDRAAILLGGKLGDAAYWLTKGDFVTSGYYMNELPEWVRLWNEEDQVEACFGKVWDRILPEAAYTIQGEDDFAYEWSDPKLAMGRTFPKRIDGGDEALSDDFYSAFWYTPFASEVLADFAKRAIDAEQLGRRGVTDMLCISFSANDLIGHAYGPGSHEVMDITVRTDRILASLFSYIDEKIGLGNCTIVLTSDHGVAPIPERLKKLHRDFPAARLDGESDILPIVEKALISKYGKAGSGQWVYSNSDYIYINRQVLAEKGVSNVEIEEAIRSALMNCDTIQAVYTRSDFRDGKIHGPLAEQALRSYHFERSGDVFYQPKPFYVQKDEYGTSHGLPYAYDAHVPSLWFGIGVTEGRFTRPASVADIAPTLCEILGILPPAMCNGSSLF